MLVAIMADGLVPACYPCGPQWYAVAAFIWGVFFLTVGIALCWFIDVTWPVER